MQGVQRAAQKVREGSTPNSAPSVVQRSARKKRSDASVVEWHLHHRGAVRHQHQIALGAEGRGVDRPERPTS